MKRVMYARVTARPGDRFLIVGSVLLAGLILNLLDLFVDTLLLYTVLFALVIAATLGAAAYHLRERQLPLLCEPMVLSLLFLAQFFVLGALFVHFETFQSVFFRPFASRRIFEALLGFFLFGACLLAGYSVQLGVLFARLWPDFSATRHKLPGIWAERLVLLASASGCLGWIWYNGGLWARLSQGYGGWRAGGALFRIAFVGLLVGTLLAAWRVFNQPDGRGRWFLVSLVLTEAVFYGLIYGVRKYLFFLFFGLTTLWALRKGVRSLPKGRTAIIVVLLVVFFSIWGTVRHVPVAVLVGLEDDPRYVQPSQIGLHRGFVVGLAGPFATACLVWELFPHVESFRHGRTLLVTLLGFIPRAVWPEKPIGIGKELARYIEGPFYHPTKGLSVAPTIPGDLYLNFGWAGILAGGLLFGVLCRAVVGYALTGLQEGQQRSAARALIPAAFMMHLGEVRGDMAIYLMSNILAYWPLLFALTFFRFDDSSK